MYKTLHKTITVCIFLACLLQTKASYAQDTDSLKEKILGQWVKYSGYRHDRIIYIPYDSPEAENVSQELRYGGVSFKKNGIYWDHLWKMCGNDDRPDYYEGSWNIKKDGRSFILTMTDIDKRRSEYLIIELGDNKLVLMPNP